MLLLLGPLVRPASAATGVPAADSAFSSLLNGLRTTLGLAPLGVDPNLSAVAQSWSTSMANSGTLSHNGALASQVQGWSKIGENVGVGDNVTLIFNALVASPGHLRNMSDPAYTRIGVGTVDDGRGRIWTTHVFMRPAAGAPAPAPRPAAPAPRAAAPAPARAPKPTTTTAAPVTVPPTTPPAPVPTTVPVPAAAPAAPVVVESAGNAHATAAPAPPAPPASPVLVAATSAPQAGSPVLLLTGAALLLALVVGGAGIAYRRSTSSRPARTGCRPRT